MNIPRITLIGVLLVSAVALPGCTGDDKLSGAPASSAAQPAISTTPTTERVVPSADMSKLKVSKLSGKSPATLPTWKAGGDIEQYSVQTLLFLTEAAKKTDLKVPPLSYAIYTGNANHLIGCNGVRQFTAYDSYTVTHCTELGASKNVILVNAKAPSWQYTDLSAGLQDHGYHPFHSFVDALGGYIVADTFGTLPSAQQEFCTPGRLYRGVVTLQPKLAEAVTAFLESNTYSPGRFTLQGYLGTCSEI